MIFLNIAVIILTLIYPLFFNLLGGISLISQAQENLSLGLLQISDYNLYYRYGVMMLVSSGLMVIADILYFCKLNILPMAVSGTGLSLCIYAAKSLMDISEKFGLSDENMQPLYEKYQSRHFPTAFLFAVICIGALIRFFSYEQKLRRSQKKQLKLDRLNKSAVKIIDDDE